MVANLNAAVIYCRILPPQKVDTAGKYCDIFTTLATDVSK